MDGAEGVATIRNDGGEGGASWPDWLLDPPPQAATASVRQITRTVEELLVFKPAITLFVLLEFRASFMAR